MVKELLQPARILLFVLVCSLFLAPTHAEAIFFPFEDMMESLRGHRQHRSEEIGERRHRSDIILHSEETISGIPDLDWGSTEETEKAWAHAKSLKSTSAQFLHVEQNRTYNKMSFEVAPLTNLGSIFFNNLLRRDTFRDRFYASPELTSLLERALPRFRKELPQSALMIGDISQPGAGLLAYGTTVRLYRDTLLRNDLTQFIARASRRDDTLISQRVVDPKEAFQMERHRWAEVEGPILVEEKLTGLGVHKGEKVGRVEMRRFYRSGELMDGELKKWWKKHVRRMSRRSQIEAKWVVRGQEKIWRVRWVYRNQFVEGEFRDRFRGKPRLRNLLHLRKGKLDRKKPGALQREGRYYFSLGPDGEKKLIAWRQLYEAGHISHINGRDADISYIMKNEDLLFSRSVGHLDVPKTRKWLTTLYDSSIEAGVQLDTLLVDRKVKRRLMRGMPEEMSSHPVWGLLSVSKGHDSHVHIRVAPGFFLGSKSAHNPFARP